MKRFFSTILLCGIFGLLFGCGAVDPPSSTPAGASSADLSFVISREGDLWRFGLPSKQWSRLTEGSPIQSATQPRVSPDGSQIAFSLRLPLPTPSPDQPFVVPTNVLATLPTAGGTPTILYAPTKGPDGAEHAYDSIDNAAWAPDGKTIYVTYQTLRFDAQGVFLRSGTDVVAVSVADGTSRVLVKDGAFPAPSPDGTSLAFVRTNDELRPKLMLFDLATNQERILLDDSNLTAMEAPIWTADSKTIYLAVAPATISQVPAPLRWIAADSAAAHGLGWRIWSIGAETGQGQEVNQQLFEDPRIVVTPKALFLWTFSGLWRIDLTNPAGPPALLFEPGDVGGISGMP